MMNQKIEEVKSIILDYWNKGLFSIIGSSILSQICSLLSSIIVIRRLAKIEYGAYVSAYNIYSYFSVFIGLGLASALIQYCSENRDESQINGIYRFALYKGILSSFALSLVILLASFFSFESNSAHYLRLMSGYPIVLYLSQYIQYSLRIKLENNKFAIYNMLISVLLVVGNVTFSYIWCVSGLIFAQYFAYCISVGLYLIFDREEVRAFFESMRSCRIASRLKKEIVRYSLICSITDFSSTVLILLDVTCLNIILTNNEVLADYKVAATIPTACLFVAQCLITYYYPHLVKAYDGKKSEFTIYIKKITKIFLSISLFITGILFVFSPLIIKVIYGDKYLNIIPIFRILSLNFFVMSGIRKLFGNLIAVIKKPEVNFRQTLIAGGLNILLDVLLIPKLASIGAAIATLITTIVIVFMESIYLSRFLKCKLAGGE